MRGFVTAFTSTADYGVDSDSDVFITTGSVSRFFLWECLSWFVLVTDQLTQESGFSAETVATIMCDFDVQLVREITGTTDVALNRDSTAVGQTLLNVPVQWSAQ